MFAMVHFLENSQRLRWKNIDPLGGEMVGEVVKADAAHITRLYAQYQIHEWPSTFRLKEVFEE